MGRGGGGAIFERKTHSMYLKKKKTEKSLKIPTRFDVYETLCPQQMLVHKSGHGICRDVTPTKFEAQRCNSFQDIMITNFHSPNLQREIIRKK